MLSVDKFPYPRKQTRGNEFIPCSNNICDTLKRFRSFKIPIITLIWPKSSYKHSVTRSYCSGKESGRRSKSQMWRHQWRSFVFISHADDVKREIRLHVSRLLTNQKHVVSANRILWVYAGFWWYHGILVVHLQDSVGAFRAKWLKKWLHQTQAPPHRGVLRWEWGNKDVHLVTTFVFCHVSKCYFFQQEFHCEIVSAKCRSLVQVTPMQSDF